VSLSLWQFVVCNYTQAKVERFFTPNLKINKNLILQKMKTLARAESYFTSTPRDNFMVFNKGLVGVVYSSQGKPRKS
jgi:hypothetical protein